MLIDSSGCIQVENTFHCQYLLNIKMTMMVSKESNGRLIKKNICQRKGKMVNVKHRLQTLEAR